MKFLGHPIHLMLIHFPSALFPMELVCYFIYFESGNTSFQYASFYAMIGGVVLGWVAIITGVTDLIMIKANNTALAEAFMHGFINSTVVFTYTVLAYIVYSDYPDLPGATVTGLLVRLACNVLMLTGNYVGGNLVLKYHIGVRSHNIKTNK